MKKVYLKLISEHTNLKNEPAENEIKILKEYEFFSHRTAADINDLYNSIRKVREDWIAFGVTTNSENIYANISFLSAFEGENETTIPAEIISIVEEFLKHDSLLNLFYPNDNDNFIEDTEEETEEETKGILLQIKGHSEINELEVIKELKKQNIKFEVITSNFLSTDVGAGNFVAEAIVYILNAAAGGIIWDVMKPGLVKINPFAQNPLDERKFDNINYKKLLKDVSQRAKIKTKDLILVNMCKKDSEAIFEFKASNSIITVICNEKYIIQDFNLEEIEVYKQSV